MLKGVDINVMLILIFLSGASEMTCFIFNSELKLSKSYFFGFPVIFVYRLPIKIVFQIM
jgi:hypothetical protein